MFINIVHLLRINAAGFCGNIKNRYDKDFSLPCIGRQILFTSEYEEYSTMEIIVNKYTSHIVWE